MQIFFNLYLKFVFIIVLYFIFLNIFDPWLVKFVDVELIESVKCITCSKWQKCKNSKRMGKEVGVATGEILFMLELFCMFINVDTLVMI